MNKLKIERFIDHELIFWRFKDLEDLKNRLNDEFNEFNLKVKDICYKSEYDNDFQDWEVLVSIGTDKEVIYDITIYYAKTRINENVIVETNFEEV